MTEITARYLVAELNHISYFMLLAAGFADYKGDLRNKAGWSLNTFKVIESLPIEWEGEPIFSDFKKNLKYSPYPIAMDVKLKGKVNGSPILIDMKREAGQSGGFKASVTINDKTFSKITSVSKLTNLIEGFAKGEKSTTESKHDIFDKYFKKNRSPMRTHIEDKFLKSLSEKRLVMVSDWYKGNVRFRVFFNDPEGEETEEIKKKIEDHNKFIPESIADYIKSYLKTEGEDISSFEVVYKVKPVTYNKNKGMGVEFTIK